MKSFQSRLAIGAFVVVFAGCSGGTSNGMLPSQSPAFASAAGEAASLVGEVGPGYIPITTPGAVKRMCRTPRTHGEMQCFALMRTDISMEQRMGASVSPDFQNTCIGSHCAFGPADLANAYKLPVSAGSGMTVATVDAYYYKNAAADLAEYRAHFGLPPCTQANKCLQIVNQNGKASPHPPKSPSDDDWQPEQALDVDMISAACPKCHIILVEANSTNFNDLGAAVDAAVKLGAQIVSNSYGGAESPGDPSTFPPFVQPNHVIVASAGDEGGGLLNHGGPGLPCAFATVVCAGGTHLTGSGSSWTQSSWNTLALDECNGPCGATGSGCSTVVPKPSWQKDSGCKMRSESDISAVADVTTPVWVYSSDPEVGGFAGFGGTSASSPLIAAMFGLAGNATKVAEPEGIWQHGGTSVFTDVTKGSNFLVPVGGKCASHVKYICTAGKGYDGPTGWGTPNGVGGL